VIFVKKGFVHMIEVIIVVVMALFAFYQFSYITTPDVDWERTKLTILGTDVLRVMDETNVNWFDAVAVKSNLTNLISSSNIVYNVELDNVIKQNINIGCLCAVGEVAGIVDALQPNPLYINSENITFTVNRIDPSNLNALLNPIYDVVIIPNYVDLNTQNLRRYLGLDKGVIELFSLTQGQVSGAQTDVFGLYWDVDIPNGAGDIVISPYAKNPGPETYTIYKYFNSFPNTTGDGYFQIGHEFEDYLGANSKVVPIGNNVEKILAVQRGTQAPAGILNWEISEKKGRTAWLPMGIPPNDQEDEKNLLKAVVAWAAGKEEIIKKSTMKNPVTVSRYKIYNTDMFQIVTIDLTLDYL